MDYLKGFSLEEEIRCDYHVTSTTKKMWATEIDLYLQLKRICEKYDIKFFAAGGTLLGAIRHKGFIPWDNDMDFLMLWDDYQRFCEVAPKELKHPYFFQQTFALSRIRNSNTTAFTKREYDSVIPPFNLGIFIDIFPLDAVPDKNLYRKLHSFELKLLRMARTGEKKVRLAKYKNKFGLSTILDHRVVLWKLLTVFGEKDLIKRYRRVCSKYNMRIQELECSYYGITSFLPYHPRYMWDKRIFEENVQYYPFENVFVPGPGNYELYLTTSYGDYHELIQDGAQHDISILDPDRPYTYYLEKLQESNDSLSREING